MTTEAKRPFVVVGVSGSTNYLEDTTTRRYWPVQRDFSEALVNIRRRLWEDLRAARRVDTIVGRPWLKAEGTFPREQAAEWAFAQGYGV